jgi:hypothetical protein
MYVTTPNKRQFYTINQPDKSSQIANKHKFSNYTEPAFNSNIAANQNNSIDIISHNTNTNTNTNNTNDNIGNQKRVNGMLNKNE